MRKIGIIATLGPSSSQKRKILELSRAGMDIARINFSHGTNREHLKTIRKIFELNKTHEKKIRIMVDLKGNRIRIGNLKKSVKIKRGEIVFLHRKPFRAWRAKAVPFDYRGKINQIKKGHFIYIDDGNICLQVKSAGEDFVKTKVVTGNSIKSNKGVNIPQADLDFPPLAPEDIEDIKFLSAFVAGAPSYIAHSFPRSAGEVEKMRRILNANGFSNAKLVAKIEAIQGVKNIDEIIKAADMIMVARGDMGISFPVWEVPFIQKKIINKCNKAKKPVITATQMLESMTEHFLPTRAEVSDVTNAIIDGTDYVMLSGETANGKYPVKSVEMMKRISEYASTHI